MKNKTLSITTLFAICPLLANAALKEVNLTKKNDLAKAIKGITISKNSTAPKIVTTQNDDDGGDGKSDGAVKVDSVAIGGKFGAELALSTADAVDKSITLNTNVFNTNTSFVKYEIQLFNKTDDKVLATTGKSMLNPKNNNNTAAHELTYTTTADDKGDEIVVRWVQLSTDSTARDIYIDNVEVKIADVVKVEILPKK